MAFEELEPRPVPGAALKTLVREDLDPYGVEELEERISALEGEIERVRAALHKKRDRKNAADALFSFGKGE